MFDFVEIIAEFPKGSVEYNQRVSLASDVEIEMLMSKFSHFPGRGSDKILFYHIANA